MKRNTLFQPLKIILSTIFLSASFAHAGSGSGAVKIVTVGGFGNGKLVFFYTAAVTSNPACDTYKRWVIDLSSPAGQQQYALLLAAQSAGKEVGVASDSSDGLWLRNMYIAKSRNG